MNRNDVSWCTLFYLDLCHSVHWETMRAGEQSCLCYAPLLTQTWVILFHRGPRFKLSDILYSDLNGSRMSPYSVELSHRLLLPTSAVNGCTFLSRRLDWAGLNNRWISYGEFSNGRRRGPRWMEDRGRTNENSNSKKIGSGGSDYIEGQHLQKSDHNTSGRL